MSARLRFPKAGKLILLLFSVPSVLFSQDFDLEQFISDSQATVPDSLLTQEAFDSLTYYLEQEEASDYGMYHASFHRSEDSLLKIYHFTGEGCGAYCNPFFMYVWAVLDTRTNTYHFQEGEQDFNFDIDSILTLDSGKLYLIFGSKSGRPRGAEGVWGPTVGLYQLKDTALQNIWEFDALTSSLVDREYPLSQLSYDPDQGLLSYVYDWYEEFADFKVYRVSGTWQFNGETFVKQDEKKEYLKE